MAICGLASVALGATIASYDASLGTFPTSQGWTQAGTIAPPSSVSGDVLSYGPTTTNGTYYWLVNRSSGTEDFATGTWSITVDLRLTGATFGNVSGFRRGGFVVFLADDAGRWIVADLGDSFVSLRNDDVGTSDPQASFNLTGAFHLVTLEAGPTGGRLLVDNVEQLTLPLGTGQSTPTLAYFGEVSILASAELTEIRSVVLTGPPPCHGDINGDGKTSVADFNILAFSFAQAVPPGTNGDLNGNGFVNASDFNILAGDFGCGF